MIDSQTNHHVIDDMRHMLLTAIKAGISTLEEAYNHFVHHSDSLMVDDVDDRLASMYEYMELIGWIKEKSFYPMTPEEALGMAGK